MIYKPTIVDVLSVYVSLLIELLALGMRLFGEIGGATLEGAGSKSLWAWLSRYFGKHFKCLEIIVV